MRPKLTLPPLLAEELRLSGKILTAEMGTRHIKLRLDGKLVGILSSKDKKLDLGSHGGIKIVTQIRRAIAEKDISE